MVSQLNEDLNLGLDFSTGRDNAYIGEILGDISEEEFGNGRPLLSCLITHKRGKREQGDGFYELCERLLGRDRKELKLDKTWENQEIAKCYEFWLDSDNHRKFK
jgi:hypothetical protein